MSKDIQLSIIETTLNILADLTSLLIIVLTVV